MLSYLHASLECQELLRSPSPIAYISRRFDLSKRRSSASAGMSYSGVLG